MQTPITDDRLAALVRNDPLAYRWYTIASRNGLTEQQFLVELLLSKYGMQPANLTLRRSSARSPPTSAAAA